MTPGPALLLRHQQRYEILAIYDDVRVTSNSSTDLIVPGRFSLSD
jgi:hypothetical protein